MEKEAEFVIGPADNGVTLVCITLIKYAFHLLMFYILQDGVEGEIQASVSFTGYTLIQVLTLFLNVSYCTFSLAYFMMPRQPCE